MVYRTLPGLDAIDPATDRLSYWGGVYTQSASVGVVRGEVGGFLARDYVVPNINLSTVYGCNGQQYGALFDLWYFDSVLLQEQHSLSHLLRQNACLPRLLF